MSYEAEASLLGCILLEPDLIFECYIQPDEFADDRHQLIMEYFRHLMDIDKPIDLVVMAEHSGKNLAKIGGVTYLMQLSQSAPSASNFNHYQEIVRKEYIRRHSADQLQNLSSAARSGMDLKEYAANAQETVDQMQDMMESSNQGDIKKMSEALQGHEKTIIKRGQQKGITGAKTASKELDEITGGHQNGDLEIIAARPSIGKTAYVVNDMIETARSGRAAAIFSLEMAADKIAERFICCIGNIESSRLRTGNMRDQDWERWGYAMDELERLPIYIDDTPGITLQQIGAKVKRLKKKHPGLVVYIDFLQLVHPGRNFTKNNEGIAYVSKGLKQIARKNECPVIAISAVGRECERRQDKRPMMSDLRESGSIESDADIVVFLYRDEYYNPNTTKPHIVELILAKGRNVGTGTVEMIFNRKTGRFLNIDQTKKEGQNNGRKTN